jgi:hypothetical protein
VIFYEFLNFVFSDVTIFFFFFFFFENFDFRVFECQDHDYEGFKSLSLKLRILAMLTDSFSHLNGHDVMSRFERPKNTSKIHIKSQNCRIVL